MKRALITGITGQLADPSKAKTRLKWTPKVSFGDLMKRMAEADPELALREMRANGADQ